MKATDVVKQPYQCPELNVIKLQWQDLKTLLIWWNFVKRNRPKPIHQTAQNDFRFIQIDYWVGYSMRSSLFGTVQNTTNGKSVL